MERPIADSPDTASSDLDSILAETVAEIEADSSSAEVGADEDGANTEAEVGDEVETPADEGSGTDASSDDPSEESGEQMVTVTVDGESFEVPLSEAIKGYQRQADYTRKTQELARERERLAAFDALDQAFQEDPVGTLQALATSMGVDLASLGQSDTRTGREDELDPDDPIQRELAELRRWRAEVDAERRAREAAERQAAVDREIEAVRVKYDPNLDEEELLRYAVENRIPNLEVAWKAMNFERRQAADSKASVPDKKLAAKRSAPKVEGGGNRKVGVVPGGSNGRMTLEDAWAAALSEHG